MNGAAVAEGGPVERGIEAERTAGDASARLAAAAAMNGARVAAAALLITLAAIGSPGAADACGESKRRRDEPREVAAPPSPRLAEGERACDEDRARSLCGAPAPSCAPWSNDGKNRTRLTERRSSLTRPAAPARLPPGDELALLL